MPTIAYVSGVGSYQSVYEKFFQKRGIDFINFSDVVAVRRDLTKIKLDMILMSLDLPVSSDKAPNEPELNDLVDKIAESGHYWHSGLYAIRQIRKEGSANRNTPIIVADVYHPSQDLMFPDAEKQVLAAGATSYHDWIMPETLRELVKKHIKTAIVR
jgi:CheY-like chemotaxis protein